MATAAGSPLPGNALIRCLKGFDDRGRDAFHAGLRRMELQRRQRQGDEDGPRCESGEDGPAEHAIRDAAPHVALGRGAAQAADEGDAALLDAVAQLPEHCGENREGAEHGDRDDDHRADREGHERAVTGEEHAGHRDQDGDARDEHGVTRGRGGRLERSALAPARGALFALTPHVEQGVVHSDCEADEQDHFHDVVAGRDALAREGDEAGRCHDGREPDEQRVIEPTSAPSTIMRMMIVSGIEIMPALARPPLISLSSAFSVETPMLSKVRPGCRASAAVDGRDDLVDVELGLLQGALGDELTATA